MFAGLHALLDAGKKVIAVPYTWSGPDFAYHSSGVLEDLYGDFGRMAPMSSACS